MTRAELKVLLLKFLSKSNDMTVDEVNWLNDNISEEGSKLLKSYTEIELSNSLSPMIEIFNVGFNMDFTLEEMEKSLILL
jgi:hypothetical protein